MADIGVNVNPTFLDVPTWRTVVDDNATDWNIAYRGAGGGPASHSPTWYVEGNQWGLDDPNYVEIFAAMDPREAPIQELQQCLNERQSVRFVRFQYSE